MRGESHAFKRAIHRIARERHRQEQLKRTGRFRFTAADPEMSDLERLACVVEEVGEVAKLVLESGSVTDLREELSQVAALAVAWMESLG